MKLNGEKWVVDRDKTLKLPLPPPQRDGYTYAIDGATGEQVKVMPAGMCGRSCRECWPEGEE